MRQVILDALGRYRVVKHGKASTAAGFPRYCVFTGGVAVTEPAPHPQAVAAMRDMIADDIEKGING